jgi:killing trait domain-containing protein
MADEHRHEHDEEEEEGRVLVDLDEILEDAPPEVQEMVALSVALSAALAAQNEVLAGQRQEILNLALSAVEAAEDILGWNAEGEGEGERGEIEGSVRSIVESLREAGEQWERSAEEAEAALAAPAAVAGEGVEAGGDFRQRALARVYAATAQALSLSHANAVAAQQKLHVTGQAVLAQVVDLLLSLVEGEAGYEEEEEEGF